ncbi:PAS and helix-turn-helix domain-containing protein [Paracoccus alcaliphilus]|uniref:PAS and helix-turn-helix domain-containing protein n=1 Tax=Paracoccus alcaliphilus TaxID=34002 RepID=UPI001FCDBF50|nr:PAS and helix-turn-helix domain-containing protein [Paracoccus alcaliphilus]WCR18927.1 PAS and helix-turn-helix domain-containing protein [Paracoccus alcaliphilus]
MDDLAQLGFANAPVGLVVTANRRIDLCNARFAAIFGYRMQDLQGRRLALLYPSTEEYDRIGRIGLAEMKATGRYDDERVMRRRDGSHFWCRVQGQSLDAANPFSRAVWSMTDISAARPLVQLTRRERQVAMLLVEGRTSKDIARALSISPRTVEAHRQKLNAKLEVRNTAECVARLAGIPGLDAGGG